VNATATKQAFVGFEKQSDFSRRDELIVEHLSLVTAIAAHVQRSLPVHVELDDLVHAGMMGLVEAATKYQEGTDVAFPAYAKHRIRGAILDGMRQDDWASRELRKRYKQVEATTRDLTAKFDRTPSEEEIASAMGLTSQRWQSLMVDFRSLGMAAAKAKATDREDQPVREIAASPSYSPENSLAKSQMNEKLQKAMATLPERYQQVVSLYYEGDLTLKQISSRLGINESRVCQIHKSALAKMQTALTSNGICSAAAF
jgi:RNA polymerase sigma factor for flagellar operon FliA